MMSFPFERVISHRFDEAFDTHLFMVEQSRLQESLREEKSVSPTAGNETFPRPTSKASQRNPTLAR